MSDALRAFRAIMVFHGDTPADLAALLGLHRQSVYNRLRGAYPWKPREIATLADRYNLTPEQTCELFMTDMTDMTDKNKETAK